MDYEDLLNNSDTDEIIDRMTSLITESSLKTTSPLSRYWARIIAEDIVVSVLDNGTGSFDVKWDCGAGQIRWASLNDVEAARKFARNVHGELYRRVDSGFGLEITMRIHNS